MASSLSMRSFTASFAATWLLLAVFVSGIGSGPMQSIARACPQDADKEPADKLDKAVRKIHDDFKEYLEQKKRLVESYEALQASIKQSEADWSRIQNEGVIKQFSAIQSAMNSMQLSNTIGSIGSAPGGNNNPNDFAMRQQLQQQLAVNRMMENMNAFMRSQELQQLGVEAQRTIRARFETIQKVMKVEEDYRQWQAGGNRFFEKYWKFTDPQKEFSTQEYQVALAALQDRDKDNLPAQLAEALLLTNKGDYSQAKELLDGLVDIEGPIQPVALMCRALALEGMDKDRDSKLSMQNSIKIDRTNPYCRWLRARLACKQDQLSIAETEWKALTTVPAMQLDAKRALALLYAQRVSKTPSNAGRAVTLASEAHEKQSPPTWYSHYVLAVSLNTAKKKDEAIKHIESAKELASQEQQEKCDKLKEAIEQDQPFEIKL
ncbi:MAG: tetratricopeptide repeat protein [Planctomycetota bacterium]